MKIQMLSMSYSEIRKYWTGGRFSALLAGLLLTAFLVVISVRFTEKVKSLFFAEPDEVLLEITESMHSLNQTNREMTNRDVLNNPETVINLAVNLIKAGQRFSQPEFFGRAQAILKRQDEISENSRSKILQAIILQHHHQFDDALEVLGEIISKDQRHAQARSIRAQILIAQARYNEAWNDCQALVVLEPVAAILCQGQINALQTGDLTAPGLLKADSAHLQASVRQSLYLTLAYMAESELKNKTAETYYKKAMTADPLHHYTRLQYTDFLISNQAYERAVSVAGRDTARTDLRLRLAVALNRLSDPEAQSVHQELVGYFDSVSSTDKKDSKEFAYFLLYLEKDYAKAADVATRNWAYQKEPADALLLLQAALAAGNSERMIPVREWFDSNRIADQRIARILTQPGGNV